MIVSLITAGGIGSRTGNSVPKQFLTVNDIPIIIYTMKNILNSACFDEMYVICSDGWKDFICSYAKQYDISIFKGTVSGGESRFHSVLNGIRMLSVDHHYNDIISIQDANRPLTPESLFREGITTVKDSDCVLPLEPCYDSMYIVNQNDTTVNAMADRSVLYKGQSPETCELGKLIEICHRAEMDGISDATIAQLMLQYGKKVMFTGGSSKNFKITTKDDIMTFKALIG